MKIMGKKKFCFDIVNFFAKWYPGGGDASTQGLSRQLFIGRPLRGGPGVTSWKLKHFSGFFLKKLFNRSFWNFQDIVLSD